MARRIAGRELLERVQQPGSQIAILDLRSPLERSNGQIPISTGLPYHHVEQRIATLVPNADTLIVLAGQEQVDELGAQILERRGYRNVAVLDNGVDGWKSAGGRLYTGTNVRSKTLGEWIEHHYATPTVDSDTLQAWRDAGENVVLLDSRPATEYAHHHIPGAYNTGGGAEIAYRAADLVDDPETTVVINCAGRTRGIVGAQSLISTGLPNKVFSLHNGTPAWQKSGRPLAFGGGDDLRAPESVPPTLAEWAIRTLDRVGAEVLDTTAVNAFLADTTTTTYVLDVREPTEYRRGHFTASTAAPGGQLVQATDEFIAVRGARVVLVDTPDFVRAANTVQWLRFLHDGPLAVLAHTADEDVVRHQSLRAPLPVVPYVTWDELARSRSECPVLVVDLRDSKRYADGHIPGSVHARREQLDDLVADAHGVKMVLVGDTEYAAEHVAASFATEVWVLAGGIDSATAVLTEDEPHYAGAIVDQTGPPDFGPERAAWYEAYFAWELSLLRDSAGDPFFAFDTVVSL